MGLPCRCAAVIRCAAVVSQRVKTLCHSTRMYPIWRLREHAPTGIWVAKKIADLPPDLCRSEPARESGVTGDDDVECAGAFAGKPAPTGVLVALKIVALHRTIVGASLLAKAVCHSAWMYLIWRLRGQARSHRDLGCEKDC